MELSEGRGPRDLTKSSNKDDIILVSDPISSQLNMPGEIDDDSSTILSENRLRKLSKSLGSLLPNDDEALDETEQRRLRMLCRTLLITAISSNLSPVHGAASLNALCGFLDQCSSSSVEHCRALAFDSQIWSEAFKVFVTRSENNKAKPSRRLLLTLTSLLLRQPVEEVKCSLLHISLSISVGAICKKGGTAPIKPAVQILEEFLSKGLVTPHDIISASIGRLVSLDEETWSYCKTENEKAGPSGTFWNQSVEDFTSSVLEWVVYPDCAPAVSKFLPRFFGSLQAHDDVENSQKSVLSPRDPPLWIKPVKETLETNPGLLETFGNYVLPGLLSHSNFDADAFLQTLPIEDIQNGYSGFHSEADIQLCLLAARNTAASGLPSQSFAKTEYVSARQVSLDPERLGLGLLDHASGNVRIAALSLSIHSSLLNAPLPGHTLDRLCQTLPHFHQETNAKTRNEFIALAKKLCSRLRAAKVSLMRQRQRIESAVSQHTPGHGLEILESAEDNSLTQHLSFERWYTMFLVQELRPTASYQSHITALRVLHRFLEGDVSLQCTSSKNLSDNADFLGGHVSLDTLSRPLFDLILDPFDDVRQWASSNLALALVLGRQGIHDCKKVESKPHILTRINFEQTLSRAKERMRNSSRADHADGVGRLYELYFRLIHRRDKSSGPNPNELLQVLLSDVENEIRLARSKLSAAVSAGTFHGHLIALRYIVNRPDFVETLDEAGPNGSIQWRDFNYRLLEDCRQVWEAVRNVLCYDAPEGHALEDEFDTPDVGSKDILSFCWRALKESSLLMHTITTNPPIALSALSNQALRDNDYHDFGELIFQQLAELRHRGAFSTVAQTFGAWCVTCTVSDNPLIAELPKRWYQDALACIQQKASALTRRSAGLPAMITGILAAYPDNKFFDDVILDLQAIADAPVERLQTLGELHLPQVHALNCLKDIFTDARFGTSSEPHIADSLEIATSCLESEYWAIRNCGLMLLKALLNRLNGGTDTSSTRASSSHRRFSKLTYEKFPNLPELILKLLRSQHGDRDQEEVHSVLHAQRVFPALEVLERFGLPSIHRIEIETAINHHLEGPVWSIREKAARALVLTLNSDAVADEVERLLTRTCSSQNALHGRLLVLRYFVAQNNISLFNQMPSDGIRVVSHLDKAFEGMVISNLCPITTAAYVNILADVAEFSLSSNNGAVKLFSRSHDDYLFQKWSDQGHSPVGSAFALERAALARYIAISYEYAGISYLEDVDPGLVSTSNFAIGSSQQYMSKGSPGVAFPNDLRPSSPGPTALFVTPQQTDESLRLLGSRIGAEFIRAQNDDKTRSKVSAWESMLIMSVDEHSEISTRLAAISSMNEFLMTLRETDPQFLAGTELLGIYLTLYDTLVDDDEDVRKQGAEVVSKVLPAEVAGPPIRHGTRSLSPPAASSRLVSFLIKNYKTSPGLWAEGVLRLAGSTTHLNVPLRVHLRRIVGGDRSDEELAVVEFQSIRELFQQTTKQQNEVFEEEKQNLYIDIAKEAETWSGVIELLDTDAWQKTLTAKLELWTINAVVYLHRMLDEFSDGPLGLTSEDEVYSLFMRVILAAKLLVAKLSGSSLEVKQHMYRRFSPLRTFLNVAKVHKLHGLLTQRLEELLEALNNLA